MRKKRWLEGAVLTGLCGALWMGVLPSVVMAAPAAASEKVAGIEEVTGIAESYGDGEFVSWAVLKYPKAIDPASVKASDFVVSDSSSTGNRGESGETVTRTISDVFVSDKPEAATESKAGRYVLLKLSHENRQSDGALQGPKDDKDDKGSKDAGGAGRPEDNGQKTGMFMISDRKAPSLSFTVTQTGTILATDGTAYGARTQPVKDAGVDNPVIASFTQHEYTDPSTGYTIPYNIYLPQGYDGKTKYPLVIFILDASANIDDAKTPLFQGNGATVWAEPAWQKDHPCIVLALQYTDKLVKSIGMMTTDENVWTPGLGLAENAIKDVISKYAVDENRIYGTGQSQGGMANIALADRNPDLFAAQFLVACQWNTQEMAAMKDSHL